MHCPVICPLIKFCAKVIVYTVTMPFLLIGFVLQGIGMLFAGLVSLAALALAVGTIAVTFAGIAAGPWLLYKNSRSDQRQGMVVEQLGDGTVLRHRSFRPEESFDVRFGAEGEPIRGERRYVGPRGTEIIIAAEELAAPAQSGTIEANAIAESAHRAESGEVTDAEASASARAAAEEAEGIAAAAAKESSMADTAASPVVPRPEWIDEILPPDTRGSRIVVKGDQCESEEACLVAYRDAVASALGDYVRERAAICLADMGITQMPWHDVTIQRIAQSLRVQPKDEFLDTHDTNFEGAPLRTYLKYGLLEISPAMRDHVDGEITRWTRSFQAASYWGILMSAVAGLYLFVKVDLAGRVFRGRNRNTPATIA